MSKPSFKLIRCQTAFFISNFLEGYDKFAFIEEMKDKIQDVFDDAPIALPIPDNAPLEIPRIILKSKDGRFESSFSKIRVDFVSQKISEESIEAIFNKQKTISERIFSLLLAKSVMINRLGFVATFADAGLEKPTNYLLKNFIKEKRLINPQEMNIIHSEKKTALSINYNHIIQLIGRSDQLIFQLDINTIPQQFLNLDSKGFEKILDYSIKQAKTYKDQFPKI